MMVGHGVRWQDTSEGRIDRRTEGQTDSARKRRVLKDCDLLAYHESEKSKAEFFWGGAFDHAVYAVLCVAIFLKKMKFEHAC